MTRSFSNRPPGIRSPLSKELNLVNFQFKKFFYPKRLHVTHKKFCHFHEFFPLFFLVNFSNILRKFPNTSFFQNSGWPQISEDRFQGLSSTIFAISQEVFKNWNSVFQGVFKNSRTSGHPDDLRFHTGTVRNSRTLQGPPGGFSIFKDFSRTLARKPGFSSTFKYLNHPSRFSRSFQELKHQWPPWPNRFFWWGVRLFCHQSWDLETRCAAVLSRYPKMCFDVFFIYVLKFFWPSGRHRIAQGSVQSGQVWRHTPSRVWPRSPCNGTSSAPVRSSPRLARFRHIQNSQIELHLTQAPAGGPLARSSPWDSDMTEADGCDIPQDVGTTCPSMRGNHYTSSCSSDRARSQDWISGRMGFWIKSYK